MARAFAVPPFRKIPSLADGTPEGFYEMETHPLPLPRASVSRPIGFTAAEVASVLELKLHHSRDRKMATAQQECNPIRWECSMLRNRTCNPFIRNTACSGTRESNRAAETKHRRGTRTAHRPSAMHHPGEGKARTVQRKYAEPAQNTNRCPEHTSKVLTAQRKGIQ